MRRAIRRFQTVPLLYCAIFNISTSTLPRIAPQDDAAVGITRRSSAKIYSKKVKSRQFLVCRGFVPNRKPR